jgi:hypothetical protein
VAATIELVRRLALALPGVQEGICFGTPAFYVRRKLMLRLWEDGETLVIRFPKEKRATLIEENPDVFSVTDHYRNYPAVLVNLLAVNRELLGRMIDGAWRLQASRKQVTAYDQKEASPRQDSVHSDQ